jgi:hypothetical protein
VFISNITRGPPAPRSYFAKYWAKDCKTSAFPVRILGNTVHTAQPESTTDLYLNTTTIPLPTVTDLWGDVPITPAVETDPIAEPTTRDTVEHLSSSTYGAFIFDSKSPSFLAPPSASLFSQCMRPEFPYPVLDPNEFIRTEFICGAFTGNAESTFDTFLVSGYPRTSTAVEFLTDAFEPPRLQDFYPARGCGSMQQQFLQLFARGSGTWKNRVLVNTSPLSITSFLGSVTTIPKSNTRAAKNNGYGILPINNSNSGDVSTTLYIAGLTHLLDAAGNFEWNFSQQGGCSYYPLSTAPPTSNYVCRGVIPNEDCFRDQFIAISVTLSGANIFNYKKYVLSHFQAAQPDAAFHGFLGFPAFLG